MFISNIFILLDLLPIAYVVKINKRKKHILKKMTIISETICL